jgi:O-methyltransferase involved in polyketide biosynthesis
LFDVLQYLSSDEQRELLARLVSSLRPGGRILVRAADRSLGWQAGLSQWLERVGRRLQLNRSHTLVFRRSQELRTDLESLGLRVECSARGHSKLLDNRLLIASR